ncbi:serine hydrolase domain-containing protein [Arhodomonas sp. SL1]|uniref:serine hydrolase domain-containing protein n=1 Tax=Arhodomonas sp. SL1 TaxID=3425691 RepID=UPI003F88242E
MHTTIKTLPASIALSLLVASSAWAQALPTADPESVGFSEQRLERMTEAFQREIDEDRLPGAVVMIAREGKLVYSETFGAQDPDGNEAMPSDAIFRIYSMSKPLVSVAAMILVEEGELQLTDPVGKYLPGFDELPVSEPTLNEAFARVTYETVPANRPMTVHDLLRHTAGLAYGELTRNAPVKEAYGQAGLYQPDGRGYEARQLTPEEQVEALAEIPLVHQPGTVWEYSLASDVLGRVVEEVSGMRLSAFLEERVFEPLGMPDTGFWVPGDNLGRLAEPFDTDPATGQPHDLFDVDEQPANDSGGAGAVSTATDYLRFSQMLVNGGELDGEQILSPATVRLMASDHLGDAIEAPLSPGELLLGTPGYTFGLGFGVREGAGIAGIPGSPGEFMWAGYGGTYFWVDPEEALVAVLMSQQVGYRAHYRRMFKTLVYQAMIE